MGELAKRTYDGGWSPDSDAVNAMPGALLRADNIIHDELGVIALRQGSAKINSTPLPDIDVHSLFTVVRAGTRYRYAGAGAGVYRDTNLIATMGGTNDTHFGSYLGQTFFARSDSKYKDDGTTVRNWGIAMTGDEPDVTAAVAGDVKELASWSETETSEHTVQEDDGNGPDYNQDQNGVDNEAIQLGTNVATGRAVVTRTFSTPQDVTFLDGGREAADDDYIVFFMFTDNPSAIIKTTLQIDVNGGSFSLDWYSKEWLGEGIAGPDGSVTSPGTIGGGGGEAGGSGDPLEGEPPLI